MFITSNTFTDNCEQSKCYKEKVQNLQTASELCTMAENIQAGFGVKGKKQPYNMYLRSICKRIYWHNFIDIIELMQLKNFNGLIFT